MAVLPELIGRTYLAVEKGEAAPIDVDEINTVACLVDRLTPRDLML